MPNKYVDFVSDTHFLKCITHVCKGYPQKRDEDLDFKKLKKNVVNPFKLVFDIGFVKN